MPPMQFREILLIVSGSTPQIITETIQALVCQNPPIVPSAIHIITTGPGRDKIQEKLIDGGILANFCREYEIPPLEIIPADIKVLRDRNGNEIDDLWTDEENELAANQIAAFLKELAADPGTRLHCSLAGGRKTMSYFMGVAFQLLARQWDCLYHIMVNPDFEKNPDFYYQPRTPATITARLRDGSTKQLNTDDAQVHLIKLPLIYLRDKLSVASGDMRTMIAEGQRTIDSSAMQLPVVVNLTERTLYIGSTLVELPPTQLTVYTAFLRLKSGPCKHPARDFCRECMSCFIPLVDMTEHPYVESMADDYQQIYGGDITKREELLEKWLGAIGTDSLRQLISKINKTIKDELEDETMLPFYLIASKRKYAGSKYGVRVEKEKIIILSSEEFRNA